MKDQKKGNIMILSGAILLVIGLVILFWYYSPKQKHNWYENYRINDKEPYGIYVVGEMMRHYFHDDKFEVCEKKPVHEFLAKEKIRKHSTYMLIGEALFLDSADIETILSFVDDGNDVFIASMDIPNELTLNLRDFQCYWKGYKTETDSAAKMNFYHGLLREKDPYTFTFYRKDEPEYYYWSYIRPDLLCNYSGTFSRLGYFRTRNDSDHLNFIKVPYGDGNFYFHTVPVAFTNYFLLKERQLDYAAKVMSHLTPGDIFWDEYSKVPHYTGKDQNGESHGESPLQFLLGQKSMRWAWFTLLFGVVMMYLLFRTKRRQRIIPLLEPNTNTSLEFVQTIGRLYFLQNNHRGLCRQMMRYFLSVIRNKYYLSTGKVSEELISKIIQRSKVDAEIVRGIFTKYDLLDRSSQIITDNELIDFHRLLEYFYKNCK